MVFYAIFFHIYGEASQWTETLWPFLYHHNFLQHFTLHRFRSHCHCLFLFAAQLRGVKANQFLVEKGQTPYFFPLLFFISSNGLMKSLFSYGIQSLKNTSTLSNLQKTLFLLLLCALKACCCKFQMQKRDVVMVARGLLLVPGKK